MKKLKFISQVILTAVVAVALINAPAISEWFQEKKGEVEDKIEDSEFEGEPETVEERVNEAPQIIKHKLDEANKELGDAEYRKRKVKEAKEEIRRETEDAFDQAMDSLFE